MDELIKKVEQWGKEKGIFDKATALTQLEKMVEEVMELSDELKKVYSGDITAIDNCKMELGDVVVTAVLLSKLIDTDIESVLQMAYNKISKRKGKMINGTFVKEEDL